MATESAPSGVVAVTPQDAPINLEVPKQSGGDNWRYMTPPRPQQVLNNGQLTIVQHPRAPSPPQDEPVDFSTKSKPSLAIGISPASNKNRHGSTSSSSEGSSTSPISADHQIKSFTSSRELKFAKNLKYLLVEILRKNPNKAKIIIRYMQHVWFRNNGEGGNKSRLVDLSKATPGDGIRQCTAANGQPSQSYVQGGNNASSGGASSGGGGNGGNQGGSAGGSGPNGGGYGSGSGGSGGNGNGNNGNNRRGGFGYGGNNVGNGSNNNNNNNEDEKESGDGNKSNNSPNNNNINSVSAVGGVVGGNGILDIGDLDFDDLPTPIASSTADWFSKHPEINTGKVINGLLNLKTEYPSYPPQPGQVGSLEKMNSGNLTGLDNATANLLQMSVPDPSTTFLDIGTDIGGCASLYEDDPFNLENLLPSNFNMNQLDVLSANGNSNGSGSMLSNMPHGPHESSVTLTSRNLLGDGPNLHQMTQHHPHELTATSPNNSMSNAAGGLTITATSITTNTQNSMSAAHHHQSQNLPSSICASLYPETTISPVMGHRQNNQVGSSQQNHGLSGHQQQPSGVNMNANHLRNLEPIPPSSLKAFIKTEPINLPQQPGIHGQLHHSQQQQQDMQPLQYIKKENNLDMHPPQHHMNNQFLSPLNSELHSTTSSRHDMYDRTPGASPASMHSPGSPPISSSYKNNMGPQGVAAMAIAALANGAPPGHPSLPDRFHFTPQMMMMQTLQSPNMHPSSSTPGPSGSGGGKMRGGVGPGGNRKRSSSSQCKDGDDDLSSVPSLQMRIKILQQRVRFKNFQAIEILDYFHKTFPNIQIFYHMRSKFSKLSILHFSLD
jgi:hypothetical protein